jgi:short-subunit dehydrogenase
MAVYYASKAYVISFSEALSQELRPLGIAVTTLCPGPVPTEFRMRAGGSDKDAPEILSVSADRVAERGYRALMAGRRLAFPSALVWGLATVAPFIPKWFSLPTIDRMQSERSAREP